MHTELSRNGKNSDPKAGSFFMVNMMINHWTERVALRWMILRRMGENRFEYMLVMILYFLMPPGDGFCFACGMGV